MKFLTSIQKEETQRLFSGRRLKRGLYQSSKRHLINADINGAANIGRKELGDEWLKKLLELDGGVFVDTPAVVRNLHASVGVRQSLKWEHAPMKPCT